MIRRRDRQGCRKGGREGGRERREVGREEKGGGGGLRERGDRRRDGGRIDMTDMVCHPNAWETLKLPHKVG